MANKMANKMASNLDTKYKATEKKNINTTQCTIQQKTKGMLITQTLTKLAQQRLWLLLSI